jgi:hypothetical protein
MLSLREFCMALYLMERYREGRALPLSINPVLFFDESGIKALRVSEAQMAAAQKSTVYNASSWQQNPSMITLFFFKDGLNKENEFSIICQWENDSYYPEFLYFPRCCVFISFSFCFTQTLVSQPFVMCVLFEQLQF